LINAGPNINSPATEWSPSFSYDGLKLYFSSGYPFRPGHVGSLDLYVSEWDGSHWGLAINLGEEVNTYGIDYCPSIASDDTTLYFASHHHHYLPCWHGPAIDIFVAYFTNGIWTNVENICEPINTNAWEDSPFISLDGDTLYFASRRDGGYDNIYFSVRQPTGIKGNDEFLKNDMYDVNVFPNPFNDQLNIKFELNKQSSFNIRVFNLLGQEIYEDHLTLNTGINVYKWPNGFHMNSEYPSGIYFLNISNNGAIFRTKFTKLE